MNERQKLVKKLINECKFTVEELATKLKVKAVTVTRWDNGERTPSYATFYFLKRLYKQTLKKMEKER